MKVLEPAENEVYSLEVIECNCGFHIGLDYTYLDQVADIIIACPNCRDLIETDKIFEQHEKEKINAKA